MAAEKITSPLISVIIPVYNGEKYLSFCLNSVLRQSYENVEIIVVNDGSTNQSAEILAGFGNQIRVITQENAGVAAARNVGITTARGKYLALLDQDDFYLQDSLENLLTSIITLEAYVVTGLTQFYFEREELRKNWPWVPADNIMDIKLFGACLIDKVVFEEIGFLNEKINMADDTEWFYRMKQKGIQIKQISVVTLNYRQHGENNVIKFTERKKDLVSALKGILDEKRSR